MEAALRELPAGTMLDDKYRIERLLAHGGMGAVYLGTHIKLRKRVAIKVLNPQLATPPMVERFNREAITASQIGHEGIAQTTDIGTSFEGEPFLVMEYLEGESLAARIRASAPLPIEVACELGCAILSPLAAAHDAGIVHRDLKPDNVFLVRQSRGEAVKLLDFGISRAQGLESEFRLTTTGLVLGTPYYMSPEQARGDNQITIAADLYAFGVILYEMLVGAVPIHADNYNQLMFRVMSGDFARPSSRRSDLPHELELLILHAMALDPRARPRSAADIETALLAFCRPTFREHTIERISAQGLPRPTPMPVSQTTGKRPLRLGSDHTVMLNPPGNQVAAIASQLEPRATVPVAKPSSRGLPIVLGLVAAVAIAIAVLVVMSSGSSTTRTPSTTASTSTPSTTASTTTPSTTASTTTPATAASTTTASTTASTVTPATTPTATPSTATPSTITLRFTVDPKDATISLDGAPIEGSEIAVRKDGEVHTLRISARGFTEHLEKVTYDESQRLVVQLKRAAAGTPPKRPPPAKTNPKTKRPERIDSESPYQ